MLKYAFSGELYDRESLDCPFCKVRCTARIRRSLWRLPSEYLVLHIKRFAWDARHEEMRRIDTRLKVSKGLNMSPYCRFSEHASTQKPYFKLEGVVSQLGTAHSGHYTALTATSQDQWTYFSDDYVSACDFCPDPRGIYLLLFRRATDLESAPSTPRYHSASVGLRSREPSVRRRTAEGFSRGTPALETAQLSRGLGRDGSVGCRRSSGTREGPASLSSLSGSASSSAARRERCAAPAAGASRAESKERCSGRVERHASRDTAAPGVFALEIRRPAAEGERDETPEGEEDRQRCVPLSFASRSTGRLSRRSTCNSNDAEACSSASSSRSPVERRDRKNRRSSGFREAFSLGRRRRKAEEEDGAEKREEDERAAAEPSRDDARGAERTSAERSGGKGLDAEPQSHTRLPSRLSIAQHSTKRDASASAQGESEAASASPAAERGSAGTAYSSSADRPTYSSSSSSSTSPYHPDASAGAGARQPCARHASTSSVSAASASASASSKSLHPPEAAGPAPAPLSSATGAEAATPRTCEDEGPAARGVRLGGSFSSTGPSPSSSPSHGQRRWLPPRRASLEKEAPSADKQQRIASSPFPAASPFFRRSRQASRSRASAASQDADRGSEGSLVLQARSLPSPADAGAAALEPLSASSAIHSPVLAGVPLGEAAGAEEGDGGEAAKRRAGPGSPGEKKEKAAEETPRGRFAFYSGRRWKHRREAHGPSCSIGRDRERQPRQSTSSAGEGEEAEAFARASSRQSEGAHKTRSSAFPASSSFWRPREGARESAFASRATSKERGGAPDAEDSSDRRRGGGDDEAWEKRSGGPRNSPSASSSGVQDATSCPTILSSMQFRERGRRAGGCQADHQGGGSPHASFSPSCFSTGARHRSTSSARRPSHSSSLSATSRLSSLLWGSSSGGGAAVSPSAASAACTPATTPHASPLALPLAGAAKEQWLAALGLEDDHDEAGDGRRDARAGLRGEEETGELLDDRKDAGSPRDNSRKALSGGQKKPLSRGPLAALRSAAAVASGAFWMARGKEEEGEEEEKKQRKRAEKNEKLDKKSKAKKKEWSERKSLSNGKEKPEPRGSIQHEGERDSVGAPEEGGRDEREDRQPLEPRDGIREHKDCTEGAAPLAGKPSTRDHDATSTRCTLSPLSSAVLETVRGGGATAAAGSSSVSTTPRLDDAQLALATPTTPTTLALTMGTPVLHDIAAPLLHQLSEKSLSPPRIPFITPPLFPHTSCPISSPPSPPSPLIIPAAYSRFNTPMYSPAFAPASPPASTPSSPFLSPLDSNSRHMSEGPGTSPPGAPASGAVEPETDEPCPPTAPYGFACSPRILSVASFASASRGASSSGLEGAEAACGDHGGKREREAASEAKEGAAALQGAGFLPASLKNSLAIVPICSMPTPTHRVGGAPSPAGTPNRAAAVRPAMSSSLSSASLAASSAAADPEAGGAFRAAIAFAEATLHSASLLSSLPFAAAPGGDFPPPEAGAASPFTRSQQCGSKDAAGDSALLTLAPSVTACEARDAKASFVRALEPVSPRGALPASAPPALSPSRRKGARESLGRRFAKKARRSAKWASESAGGAGERDDAAETPTTEREKEGARNAKLEGKGSEKGREKGREGRSWTVYSFSAFSSSFAGRGRHGGDEARRRREEEAKDARAEDQTSRMEERAGVFQSDGEALEAGSRRDGGDGSCEHAFPSHSALPKPQQPPASQAARSPRARPYIHTLAFLRGRRRRDAEDREGAPSTAAGSAEGSSPWSASWASASSLSAFSFSSSSCWLPCQREGDARRERLLDRRVGSRLEEAEALDREGVRPRETLFSSSPVHQRSQSASAFSPPLSFVDQAAELAAEEARLDARFDSLRRGLCDAARSIRGDGLEAAAGQKTCDLRLASSLGARPLSCRGAFTALPDCSAARLASRAAGVSASSAASRAARVSRQASKAAAAAFSVASSPSVSGGSRVSRLSAFPASSFFSLPRAAEAEARGPAERPHPQAAREEGSEQRGQTRRGGEGDGGRQDRERGVSDALRLPPIRSGPPARADSALEQTRALHAREASRSSTRRAQERGAARAKEGDAQEEGVAEGEEDGDQANWRATALNRGGATSVLRSAGVKDLRASPNDPFSAPLLTSSHHRNATGSRSCAHNRGDADTEGGRPQGTARRRGEPRDAGEQERLSRSPLESAEAPRQTSQEAAAEAQRDTHSANVDARGTDAATPTSPYATRRPPSPCPWRSSQSRRGASARRSGSCVASPLQVARPRVPFEASENAKRDALRDALDAFLSPQLASPFLPLRGQYRCAARLEGACRKEAGGGPPRDVEKGNAGKRSESRKGSVRRAEADRCAARRGDKKIGSTTEALAGGRTEKTDETVVAGRETERGGASDFDAGFLSARLSGAAVRERKGTHEDLFLRHLRAFLSRQDAQERESTGVSTGANGAFTCALSRGAPAEGETWGTDEVAREHRGASGASREDRDGQTKLDAGGEKATGAESVIRLPQSSPFSQPETRGTRDSVVHQLWIPRGRAPAQASARGSQHGASSPLCASLLSGAQRRLHASLPAEPCRPSPPQRRGAEVAARLQTSQEWGRAAESRATTRSLLQQKTRDTRPDGEHRQAVTRSRSGPPEDVELGAKTRGASEGRYASRASVFPLAAVSRLAASAAAQHDAREDRGGRASSATGEKRAEREKSAVSVPAGCAQGEWRLSASWAAAASSVGSTQATTCSGARTSAGCLADDSPLSVSGGCGASWDALSPSLAAYSYAASGAASCLASAKTRAAGGLQPQLRAGGGPPRLPSVGCSSPLPPRPARCADAASLPAVATPRPSVSAVGGGGRRRAATPSRASSAESCASFVSSVAAFLSRGTATALRQAADDRREVRALDGCDARAAVFFP
ncbi:hypothetical protein BESB_055330 [Besnoitia besnoiti]|uniref:USP domain-containing protein n=1 Tax=Besnoitia besnoiti TaxID=94643 RepID=A0A2A9MKE1_BESBE|nr:hypothetical protein BESB_055330 [Besnoitia besnoiti]PFH35882.1 hypothetical protein BESB_055330 [Besnoitia besnoiti]